MSRAARRSALPAGTKRSSPRETAIAPPPDWIEPQLCKLVQRAPGGDRWVHEIKLDGYRMAARIDRGDVQLLTRSGPDKYPETAAALAELPVTSAYIDGELCGVGADGVTSLALMQSAGDALVYFAFDLLALDGAPIGRLPQVDSQNSPGNRGIWVKRSCLNRAEFIIVGWTEGSRSSIGALLLGYYAPALRVPRRHRLH